MGCSPSRESIESEILMLRLVRTQIQDEKKQILKELEKMTGKKIVRPQVPDYLIHSNSNNKSKIIHPKRKSNKKINKKQSTKPDENEFVSYDENDENYKK